MNRTTSAGGSEEECEYEAALAEVSRLSSAPEPKTHGRGFEVARSLPPGEGAPVLQGGVIYSRCGRFSDSVTLRGRQEA